MVKFNIEGQELHVRIDLPYYRVDNHPVTQDSFAHGDYIVDFMKKYTCKTIEEGLKSFDTLRELNKSIIKGF